LWLPNTRPNKNKITEENTIVKVEILSYFWHAEQGLNGAIDFIC